jgi:hypothetical protein
MGGRRVSDESSARVDEARAALQARYEAVRPLLPAFVRDVLQAPWALVSPASRLSDFDSLARVAELRERVLVRYGVDVRTLADDLIVTVLEAAGAADAKREGQRS